MEQLPVNDKAKPETAEEDLEERDKKVRAGAQGFYWVAALSLINSVLWITGSRTAFMMGLGITQFFDLYASRLSDYFGYDIHNVAFAIDVLAAFVFAVFGFFVNRLHRWAMWVGLILYGLDGLLFLAVPNWWGFGFHVLLFVIILLEFISGRHEENTAGRSPVQSK